MRIVVRRAQERDLEAINRLTDDLHKYLAGLYELELSAEELEEEHFDRDELEDVYVAEEAERGVVGYISFSRSRDEWAGPHYSLEHLVVREECTRAGVGEMLFDTLLERAKREEMNITTGTLARNEGALRFYEKTGFKPFTIGLLLDLKKRIPNL